MKENNAFKFGYYFTVLFSLGFGLFLPTPSNFGSLSHHCHNSSSFIPRLCSRRLFHRRSISCFILCNFFNSSKNVMFRFMIHSPSCSLLKVCSDRLRLENHYPSKIFSHNPSEVNRVNAVFLDKKGRIFPLERLHTLKNLSPCVMKLRLVFYSDG